MELTLFQILAAAVCLAVALVGLGLPALLRHSASALSIGNCLAAGCILGGGLLHLLPDAAESLADVGGDYPTGHLVFSLGLLLPIVIEQLAASYVASHKQRRPLLRTSGAPQRAAYDPPAAAEAPCEHDHGHAEAHGHGHTHGEGGDCCEHEHEHGHDHSSESSDALQHDHHDVTDGGRLPLSSAMVLLLALSFHTCTLCAEGILLGARQLGFLAKSYIVNIVVFLSGLLVVDRLGLGLRAVWTALFAFQILRFGVFTGRAWALRLLGRV